MILSKLDHNFFTFPLTRQINIHVSNIKIKASSLMLSTSCRDMMCMQERDASSKRKEVKITLFCFAQFLSSQFCWLECLWRSRNSFYSFPSDMQKYMTTVLKGLVCWPLALDSCSLLCKTGAAWVDEKVKGSEEDPLHCHSHRIEFIHELYSLATLQR